MRRATVKKSTKRTTTTKRDHVKLSARELKMTVKKSNKKKNERKSAAIDVMLTKSKPIFATMFAQFMDANLLFRLSAGSLLFFSYYNNFSLSPHCSLETCIYTNKFEHR